MPSVFPRVMTASKVSRLFVTAVCGIVLILIMYKFELIKECSKTVAHDRSVYRIYPDSIKEGLKRLNTNSKARSRELFVRFLCDSIRAITNGCTTEAKRKLYLTAFEMYLAPPATARPTRHRRILFQIRRQIPAAHLSLALAQSAAFTEAEHLELVHLASPRPAYVADPLPPA